MPAWHARSASRSPMLRPGRCQPRRPPRRAAPVKAPALDRDQSKRSAGDAALGFGACQLIVWAPTSALEFELADHAGEFTDLPLDVRSEIGAADAMGIERY